MDYNDIENTIDGYKYLVEFNIVTAGSLKLISGPDRLCICNTRDECIEEIRKHIELNKESYLKDNIEIQPYNIDRFGSYVKWVNTKDESSWIWEYGIHPIKYINENDIESKCDAAVKLMIDQFYNSNFDPTLDYYKIYQSNKLLNNKLL